MLTDQIIKLDNSTHRIEATNVDLSGSTFSDVNLSGASLDDINLSGATIANACFAGVTIRDANLSGMSINGIAVDDLLAAYNAATGTV